MPFSPSYPGIYIQELRSSSHTITAAATSIAVFVGYTHPFKTKLFSTAVRLFSFADYENYFGGLYTGPTISQTGDTPIPVIDNNVAFAVYQFFLNGGSDCYVVGIEPQKYYAADGTDTGTSVIAASDTINKIKFTALEPTSNPDVVVVVSDVTDKAPGTKNAAHIAVKYGTKVENYDVNLVDADPDNILTKINGVSKFVTIASSLPTAFKASTYTLNASQEAQQSLNGLSITAIKPAKPSLEGSVLTVAFSNLRDLAGGTKNQADLVLTYGNRTETFRNVNLMSDKTKPEFRDFLPNRINGISTLVTVKPDTSYPDSFTTEGLVLQADVPTTATHVFNAGDFSHLFDADQSLDLVPIFNLLVLPGITDNGVLSAALAFAERKQAFLIMDAPRTSIPAPEADNNWVGKFIDGDGLGSGSPKAVAPLSQNGALYFPYLVSSNPLDGNPINLPPSGFVAGIFARTDTNRGVWKAPAGLEATVLNTVGVVDTGRMNDPRQGVLNLLGVNCLRTLPGVGTVVFGARTLVSNNVAFQDYKYVPVRRMALFIEQTLYRNLKWVIFEPNDMPLWVSIRTSIENFMLSLYNQGALQGDTPSKAFRVQCDATTTTPDDVANGIVNIIVAFAPLKPAEFVVVKITQLAGQAQS